MKKLLIFISLVTLCACKTGVKNPNLEHADLGWEMFNYPRTNMQPGYIFRIKEGESIPQEVTTLKTEKPFDTAYAYLPEVYRKKTLEGKTFLKFLFLNPNDTTVKANGKKNHAFSVNIGKGFIESIDEPTIDNLIKKSNINWRENNKYYIIQSTLSAKKIRYTSNKSSKFDSDFILSLSKITIAGEISKDKNDSTVLNQDFDRNYRIYYRALEINSMGAASGNNKIYTYKEVTIPIKD